MNSNSIHYKSPSVFNTKPLYLAVLMAVNTISAFAETTADTLPEVKVQAEQPRNDYNEPVSTVGGKMPTAVRDIPQSVTILNRAVLDAKADTSLADALRNVPGITIGGAEGGQIGTNINLRGFSARTDMYVDGMRDRGQYYRDTFYLSAVEVLKGPSSMLFGRGSTGGVVNQVRKKPVLGDSGEVSATMGTNGYYRTTGDYNKQLTDTAATRVEVMGQNVGSTRDVMDNEDYAIAPSLRLGIGTDTQINFSALVERNHDQPDYGIPTVNGKPAKVNYDNYYGLTDDRTNQNTNIFGVSIQHKFNDNLTFRNQTQYANYETDARETAFGRLGTVNGLGQFVWLGATPAATGNYTNLSSSSLFATLASHDRKIDDNSFDNQTDLIAKFNTESLKHTMIVGLELGHDEYSNQTYSRSNSALTGTSGSLTSSTVALVSLNNPTYFSTPVGTVTTTGNLAKSTADTLATYVNDTIEFNPQWKAVLGLRWDRFQASINNSINSTNTVGNTTLANAGCVKFMAGSAYGARY